jgi:hypothetical protein
MATQADAIAAPFDNWATVLVLTSQRPSAAKASGICLMIH